MKSLDINAQFQKAVDIIELTTRNLLIFGKAGTGKSTFLKFFRDQTKKNVVVLAPTGVAAINVSGMTIHSFFGFSIDLTLDKVKKLSQNHRARKILKTLDTIIIDEISMVRADLLDCVDKFLKLNGPKPALSFGGIQMVFIGDLYQIPPIVTNDIADHFKNYYSSPYFFSAKIFLEAKNSFEFIEFEKVYRQNDADFIGILNAIRNNTTTAEHLELLNQRYQPTFQPAKNDFWVHITGTNQAVKNINDAMLHKLNSEEKVLSQSTKSPDSLEISSETGINNLYSKAVNSVLYNYDGLLQNIVYGLSLVLIGIILSLILFSSIFTFKKELVFRVCLILILLSASALLNKDAVIALIPHQIII